MRVMGIWPSPSAKAQGQGAMCAHAHGPWPCRHGDGGKCGGDKFLPGSARHQWSVQRREIESRYTTVCVSFTTLHYGALFSPHCMYTASTVVTQPSTGTDRQEVQLYGPVAVRGGRPKTKHETRPRRPGLGASARPRARRLTSAQPPTGRHRQAASRASSLVHGLPRRSSACNARARRRSRCECSCWCCLRTRPVPCAAKHTSTPDPRTPDRESSRPCIADR